MLFEASGTCAPGLLALHMDCFSRVSLFFFLLFYRPFYGIAKYHNVQYCLPSNQARTRARARVNVHVVVYNEDTEQYVTYVTCIKMQTMIRTTLRSHARTIHSPTMYERPPFTGVPAVFCLAPPCPDTALLRPVLTGCTPT